MKKFLTATLIAIVISTAAFGATSNDVYLRQDVFEAKMDAFMAEIRLMNEQTRSELRKEIQDTKTELQKEIQNTKKEIQDTKTELQKEIQDTKTELNEKIQGTKTELQKEIQDTKTELQKEIQDTKTELNEKIQANTTAIQQTNARIDVTNARLESLITMVYWGIALLGILITLAAVAPSIVQVLKGFSKSKITLEDVERLIDAKLQAKNAQGI